MTTALDLFIQAPGLQHVNEDQSFEITISVTSSTNTEATTSKTLLISMVNQGDWNDDDGDGVPDNADECQFGETGWTPDSETDHDGDGCRDSTEDLNDDNDDYLDVDDSCPTGYMGVHVDLDADGCDDLNEDTDNDADGVENHLDMCPTVQHWEDSQRTMTVTDVVTQTRTTMTTTTHTSTLRTTPLRGLMDDTPHYDETDAGHLRRPRRRQRRSAGYTGQLPDSAMGWVSTTLTTGTRTMRG